MKTQNTDNRYDVLVFDFDNTLFDYELTECQALKEVFNKIGYEFKPEFHSVFKLINRELWEKSESFNSFDKFELRIKRFSLFFAKLGYNVDAGFIEYVSDLFVRQSRHGVLIDGVYSTLCSLKKRGIVIAVASSGLSDPRIYKLKNSSIAELVDYSLFREDFPDGCIKPNTGFYIEIAERHPDVTLNRILYIGDNFECDVKAPKMAGLSNVWFNYFNVDESSVEMQYCDSVIYEFSELLKIVLR